MASYVNDSKKLGNANYIFLILDFEPGFIKINCRPLISQMKITLTPKSLRSIFVWQNSLQNMSLETDFTSNSFTNNSKTIISRLPIPFLNTRRMYMVAVVQMIVIDTISYVIVYSIVIPVAIDGDFGRRTSSSTFQSGIGQVPRL